MYYLHLSLQYMRKNKARTLYSVFGIVLTFVLCFSIMTAYYSMWDYTYLSSYEAQPYELMYYDRPEGGFTEEMLRQVKRLETYPNTEKLTVRDYRGRVVFPSQMKRGEQYQLTLKLKDTSALYKTAEDLLQQCGIPFSVRTDVAQYLHQGDTTQDALGDFMITLLASIFGLFSAAILRNTMLISVTERVRDYGLFRCVGMSKGQLRTMLFIEGMVLSLIASVLGIGLGYLGLQCITPWLRKALQLQKIFSFRFYPKAAGYTSLLCVAVTLFSLIEPSRQAGLVTPISALHGNMGGNIGLPVKRRKKNGGKLWEKIFGVSGLYAYRNMKRSKGRGGSVLFAMFFSTAFLLTILSFTDSMEASVQQDIGIVEFEYRGQIETDDDRMIRLAGVRETEIIRDVKQFDGVGDAMVLLHYLESTKNPYGGLMQDPYIRTLTDNKRIAYVYHTAYEKEQLEELTPYLLEGSIDYAQMTAQHGVLLCDTDPAKKANPSSQNSVLNRLTNYKVGDTIRVLSIEGRKRVKDAYLAAAWEVAERHHLNYMLNSDGKPVPVPWEADADAAVITQMIREGSDEKRILFDTCLEEMLTAMQREGYDCATLLENKPLRMINLIEPALTIEYAKGSVTELAIMGIVSADPIHGGYVQGLSDGCLELIYPMDEAQDLAQEVIMQECPEDPAADGLEYSLPSYVCYMMPWRASVYLKSEEDKDLPDDLLGRYAMAGQLNYINLMGEDYLETLRMLRVMRVGALVLSCFIILVCMIQIINTLQANMRLRRKELWLYDVVGMSPKQKFGMILIEHGLSAIEGVGLGMAGSFAFSYWMLEMMLDVNKDQPFIWPVKTAVLIAVLILLLILCVNYAEIRRAEKNRERVL